MSDFRAKEADEKFCAECGSIIKAKAEICPNAASDSETRQIYLTNKAIKTG
ncbi:MAG: hypothetical protein LBB59_01565 [Campylobacteraceae bacterium]|nr:hypothetical protein [Campylobacteraceae bacterium]